MNLSQKKKRWSKDVVKYIAMAAMLLNHIAYIFYPRESNFEIFLNLGYLTAVTMCYFPSGGYQYTHSKEGSICRDWFLFAFLSQIPYSLAFTSGTYIEFHGFSMMTTHWSCVS